MRYFHFVFYLVYLSNLKVFLFFVYRALHFMYTYIVTHIHIHTYIMQFCLFSAYFFSQFCFFTNLSNKYNFHTLLSILTWTLQWNVQIHLNLRVIYLILSLYRNFIYFYFIELQKKTKKCTQLFTSFFFIYICSLVNIKFVFSFYKARSYLYFFTYES